MQPQKNPKFPRDLFVTLNKDQPRRKMHALAPIITKTKKQKDSPSPLEDITPYFKPMSKYSSCCNLVKIFDTPVLPYKIINFPSSDKRKIVLPSLKPKMHLKKESNPNSISPVAFNVIHKKLFSDNQSTDLGATFSRDSVINSRASFELNIFPHNS